MGGGEATKPNCTAAKTGGKFFPFPSKKLIKKGSVPWKRAMIVSVQLTHSTRLDSLSLVLPSIKRTSHGRRTSAVWSTWARLCVILSMTSLCWVGRVGRSANWANSRVCECVCSSFLFFTPFSLRNHESGRSVSVRQHQMSDGREKSGTDSSSEENNFFQRPAAKTPDGGRLALASVRFDEVLRRKGEEKFRVAWSDWCPA